MDEPEGQGEAMDSQYQEPNINNANVEQGIIFIILNLSPLAEN